MASAIAGADIDLVISDIDNTLIDLCNQWEKLTTPFLNEVGAGFGQEGLDAILAEVSVRPAGGRIHAFPEAARRVLEETGLWRKASPEQQQAFRQAAHRWFVDRDRYAEPYAGVIETIRAIKESGRSFAIHTDAMMVHALVRLKTAGIPADLIDRIYAQPDPGLSDRSRLREHLRKSPDPYLASLADRAVPLEPRSTKWVNKTNTAAICGDFRAPPERALHVGDNIPDAATALAGGVNFVWQEEGSVLGAEAVALLERTGLLNGMPGHDEIGAHLDKMAEENPDFRMTRLPQGFAGLSELLALPAPEERKEAETEFEPSLALGL